MMRTPAGRGCSYYYEDFNRGAEITRCRVKRSRGSAPWRARQCKRCPVPDIEAANGSPCLDLTLTVSNAPLGLLPERFRTDAWCGEHGPIADPYVGCLECVAKVDV
ncbi:MAG TPA: hypothetical protein VGK50_08410 [Coriobacteriia bacterium]|jgi:hypothetical protein